MKKGEIMKEIKINTKSIKLGQFLKFSGVISTGGEVKYFLENNDVFVNKKPVNSRGKQLFDKDIIEINNQQFIIVSQNEDK